MPTLDDLLSGTPHTAQVTITDLETAALAAFAGADIVAMGVLTAIDEAGLAVPADISVAGYDNTPFAALGPISLTTID